MHPRQVADGFLMLAAPAYLAEQGDLAGGGIFWPVVVIPGTEKACTPVSALLPCLRWHRPHRIQVQLALSPPGYGTDREQVLARQAPTGAYGARRTPLPVNGSGGPVGASSLGLGGRSSRSIVRSAR